MTITKIEKARELKLIWHEAMRAKKSRVSRGIPAGLESLSATWCLTRKYSEKVHGFLCVATSNVLFVTFSASTFKVMMI